MQNRPPQASPESEQAQLLLTAGAVLFLCWFYFDTFVYATSWVLYWMWMMVDFPAIHMWVGGKINLLASLANHSQEATFDEWLEVMNQTSGILMVLLVPLVALSGFGLIQHPMVPWRSRRLINVDTLPKIVSAFAPSVIPVLAATGRDGLMNDTSPENAWALKPEEFAEQHNLISRQVLDREAARVLFEVQVGEPHAGLQSLAPHERALFAVFGAQVFLNDRKAATRLLDDLNRSCMVRGLSRRKRAAYTPIYSLANKLFARLENAPGVSEWLSTHLSVRSALVGLYGQDLRLPPARFRWLKGIDRTLWYGLHTADTAKVYVEGSGIVAQARAECKAVKLGLPRPGKLVTKAIDGLQAELESIGLVFPREKAAPLQRDVIVEPALTEIYSTEASPELA